MEEVLDVYTRPHDPEMPLVCLDETSKQLVSETRTPVPMTPGQPERIDYEYECPFNPEAQQGLQAAAKNTSLGVL